MDKDEREIDYSARSVTSSIGIVIWAIFGLLVIVGTLLSIAVDSPTEDQPNPAPSSNPTVEEWSDPNFDNLDQDGFTGGQR
jgi:hypothetical protein